MCFLQQVCRLSASRARQWWREHERFHFTHRFSSTALCNRQHRDRCSTVRHKNKTGTCHMIWWIVWTSRYSFTVTTLSRSDSSQESSEKPVFLFPLDFSVSHSPFAGSTDMGSEKLNCTFSSSAETELDSDGRSGGTRESGVASPRVRIAIMNESADNGPTTFTSERSKHQVMRCCGEPIIVSKPPLMWLNFIITTSTRRGGSPSYGSCTAVQFSMHCVVGSPGSAVVLRGGGWSPWSNKKTTMKMQT